MDRELIARNIINVIDVKHCSEYSIFMGDDLYDQLYKYLIRLVHNNKDAIKDIDITMTRIELIINKIVANKQITQEEKNTLRENLIAFKRKWLMKK